MSTPAKKQGWSLIIFCYNEVSSVRHVVSSAYDFLTHHASEFEIIVVDDGSIDGSTEVIRGLSQGSIPISPIFHDQNRGIGQALQSGYRAARFENICALPADGQFAIQELIPFASVPKGAFVSFFREQLPGYNWFRNLLTWVNRKLNRMVIGLQLRDVNWVKIYKREELQNLDLQLESSLVESEICAKLTLRGNHVIETPSQYQRRTSGVSKAGGARSVLRAAKDTFKLFRVVTRYRRRYLRATLASKST